MNRVLVITLLLGAVLILASCNGKRSASRVNPNERAVMPAAVVPAHKTSKGLSDAQFEFALRNVSTAPNYVLITVIDANVGKQQTVCIESEALLWAINIERKLNREEAVTFSLEQENRAFRFSNARALKLASRAYSETMLAEAREFLANMTIEEIDTATRDQSSKFYQLRQEPRGIHCSVSRNCPCSDRTWNPVHSRL